MANLCLHNRDHGMTEALCRGFRTGFLSDTDYHHLTQCESLEDVKMNLAETDYDAFLANEASVSPAVILECATKKMVAEFQFLRAQAVEPLATFLDYITFEYMIDNVMLLLKGTISGRDVGELIEQCHPLGMFRDSTMRSIPTFENSPKGYADLYQTVLVDTPEVEMEIIKHSLMKLYLEDFYYFCCSVGGDTAEIMGEILKARADQRAINITLNSFGTPLNEPSMRSTDREAALPMLELAFEGQMHFGIYYAYVKLKEQEIRNLVWISECIVQQQKDEINKFVPCFSSTAPWRAS
ncbi:proton-exporting ATPase [Aureococcus anophagefferens]|nr:proton-exporting ATPase [Aureococcus anophagefferens]